MFFKNVNFGSSGAQDTPTLGPSAGPKNENFKKIKKRVRENTPNYLKTSKLQLISIQWLPG